MQWFGKFCTKQHGVDIGRSYYVFKLVHFERHTLVFFKAVPSMCSLLYTFIFFKWRNASVGVISAEKTESSHGSPAGHTKLLLEPYMRISVLHQRTGSIPSSSFLLKHETINDGPWARFNPSFSFFPFVMVVFMITSWSANELWIPLCDCSEGNHSPQNCFCTFFKLIFWEFF